MGKNKQRKQKKDKNKDNMREPKEGSIKRDKNNGWDHEAGTQEGKDVSYAIFDKPAKNTKQIYVKLPEGSFKFSPREDIDPAARRRRRRRTLPHSMLAKGGKVIGAGECETDKEGKITRADNFSGHYQPNEENLQQTKNNMEKQGLAREDTKFEVFDKSGKVIKKL